MSASARVSLGLLALLLAAGAARAGSTEPDLAVAGAQATVRDGVVTLAVLANYDHDNALRLGYPVAVVVVQGTRRAALFLDGRTTLSVDGGPENPVAGARGVIAIAPTRITAVLPSGFAVPGSATVSLEATFDDATLRSNTVPVSW